MTTTLQIIPCRSFVVHSYRLRIVKCGAEEEDGDRRDEEKDGKCMHNAVVHEHEYIKEDAVFRQPHRNCCVCGKV